MKRLKIVLLVVLALAALAVGAVYLFIPAKITVSKVVTVKLPASRMPDFFLDMDIAGKWMPGTRSGTGKCFQEKDGTAFCIIDNGTGNVVINTKAGNLPDAYAYVYFDNLRADSAAVTYTVSYSAGNSPFSRLNTYLAAHRLKTHINRAFDSLVALTQNKQKLYGFQPVHEQVKDTLSISRKKILDHYPGIHETDSLLQQLRQYVQQQGATVTRPGMMHVLQTDKNSYEVMVALPIDRVIPNAGDFILKRMPNGKIIAATITGGLYTIRKELLELEQYKNDRLLTSPAIPYQSMVTNRAAEPDTGKWVTVLYYPVF